MPFASNKLAFDDRVQGDWTLLERRGEGTTSVVWRARHRDSGAIGAIKVARSDVAEAAANLAGEAMLLARIRRRWGPAVLDAGTGFLVTEWIDGEPLIAIPSNADRPRVAAVVAHAIGRALEELHEAGIRHGDVKPANVLLALGRPTRDAAAFRGATLIDLGLATESGAPVRGGTPRYASPELRSAGFAGPAADLWALGMVLAEILDPAVAQARDPGDVLARRTIPQATGVEGEPARWAQALLAALPGGRPSAGWIASRAARWLGIATDEDEASQARVERVRRAYLKERAREIVADAEVSESIDAPAGQWLRDALAWTKRSPQPSGRPPVVVEPLGAVRRARWLVMLVGPSAASWSIGADESTEGALAARLVALARACDPASWTRDDVLERSDVRGATWATAIDGEVGVERTARLVRGLAHAAPGAHVLRLAEDEAAADHASLTLVVQLASALLRAGETGRAWAALASATGPEVDALRAEVARRRGDEDGARLACERVLESNEPAAADFRSRACATLSRLAWDRGDVDEAERAIGESRGAAAAEARALVAWRKGAYDRGLRAVERALADPLDADEQARLESVRGMLEMGRGRAEAALHAFGRAVDFATRSGSVVDEATYLTSEAAAASDAGAVGLTLASATRAALLWERLGRPAHAARSWLARAGALATVGVRHATDEAAEEARTRAVEVRDERAIAYARWARIEVRDPGDGQARAWAIEAAERLRGSGSEDMLRAAARQLVWAPDSLGGDDVTAGDHAAAEASPAVRWEWWGARARRLLEGRDGGDASVLGALLALVDVPAPLGSRGPALDAAVRLAKRMGDGDAARRFEAARVAAARMLREGMPRELEIAVAWAQVSETERITDVAFAPAQVEQLESIVRALSGRDRLRSLLEQVLDTMVLWTGVERGLLLLRAPDGRLVPRAARNLARDDLAGDQLALSQTIARRAVETGDAVVATDALSTLGDVHASVHALRLRSVLAVPLIARGETLGVVYLDDRVRKGAFGPRELSWVRVVASQAASAIADARDAVLLRRAARRAERARARIETLLREREAELDVTRTQLELARDAGETRYRYDDIAGRSEPMRVLLRLVDRVTASDVPVLVVGESGTGKELVARAMHHNGARARKPFVTENCASVAESLLESTLFGHVRGAFTGALAARAGLFEVADGGTLFLDEIGEMSLAMQAKLLRVLQDGEVRAVGGERVRKVDVRVIGATHRDLGAMVATGGFREDLLYRLNVITLHVPALRERPEDIPLLVAHFVGKHAAGKKVKVTRAATTKLTAYPWPGNVRQLENEIRRALVLGDGVIDVDELSADVVRGGAGAARASGLDLRARVDALETDLLLEALAKTRGNQTRAAQLLGLSRFGLQKMIKRLGIKPPGAVD